MILNKLTSVLYHFIPTSVMQNLIRMPCKEYDSWIRTLPDTETPGIKDICRDWIHSWGNGGGDYSIEACIRDALDENGTDVPRETAGVIYGSICDYSKSAFEASTLVMTLMDECLTELEQEETNE